MICALSKADFEDSLANNVVRNSHLAWENSADACPKYIAVSAEKIKQKKYFTWERIVGAMMALC